MAGCVCAYINIALFRVLYYAIIVSRFCHFHENIRRHTYNTITMMQYYTHSTRWLVLGVHSIITIICNKCFLERWRTPLYAAHSHSAYIQRDINIWIIWSRLKYNSLNVIIKEYSWSWVLWWFSVMLTYMRHILRFQILFWNFARARLEQIQWR